MITYAFIGVFLFILFTLSYQIDDGQPFHIHVLSDPIIKTHVNKHYTIKDYKDSFENDNSVNKKRRAQIRNAMQHAFSNYEKFAWKRDELLPLSHDGHDWLPGGAGLTIIDAMDTLYIMGLEEEFEKSLNYITNDLPPLDQIDNFVSLFEITIRMLGGLLSAYDLSQKEIFLTKAKELADRLLPAFNTHHGIPHANVNLKTQEARTLLSCSSISEYGTLSLEFTHLSELTGNPKYRQVIEKITHVIEKQRSALTVPGLYRVNYDPNQDRYCDERITLGALGDSFYEYLHKQWLLSDKKDERYREMFEESVKGIMDNLLVVSDAGHTYISEMEAGALVPKIDHLVCFAAGMLGLSHATNATYKLDGTKYNTLKAGTEFIKTCYESYKTTTGLAPEIYRVNFKGDIIVDPGAKHNLKRPETVESLFLLHRITGDKVYKEMGWSIFTAMEKYSKVENGYSGVKNVEVVPVEYDDKQQSFFLAETLKYLYLLYSPSDLIPLDDWVFNTEAHPFKIKRDI